MQERNQLRIVTVNSFWSVSNFIMAGIFGFIFSIILTRYLGPQNYGRYGYVVSIISLLVFVFDLGISQAISKYIPKFFSDDKNKIIAIKFYKRVTLIQFIVSSLSMLFLFLIKGIWLPSLDISFLSYILFILLFIYIPLISMVNTLVGFVGASQNYKNITISNSIVYVLNMLLLAIGVYFDYRLDYFLFVLIAMNLLTGIILFIYSSSILRSNKGIAEKKINNREALHFTSLAYVNLLVQYVVWSYSEIFFLKKYSTIENVGFYTLAFTIATMLGGILRTAQKSVNNAQFELIEQGREDKSDIMVYLTIKYSAILFLPFVILISLFMANLIGAVYGSAYSPVAIVFPYVVLALAINIIFSPIMIKANNNNKYFSKVVWLIFLGAIINLSADYLLIPKYQLIGAGYANILGQSITILLVVGYVLRNIKFNFSINKILKILAINIALAIITYVFHLFNNNIWYTTLFSITVFVFYIKALKIFNIFEEVEYNLVLSLQTILPKRVVNVFKFIYNIYKHI